MKENKRALIILQMMVLTAVVIFFVEKKFLVNEARGSSLSHYDNFKEIDKIILLVDDFEGFGPEVGKAGIDSTMRKSGFFDYGGASISLDHKHLDKNAIASKTALKVSWNGKEPFGGWGKGVGAIVNIDANTDHLSFRVYNPASNGDDMFRIMMYEDDNDNGKLEEDLDDKWVCEVPIKAIDQWQMISVPLKNFKDGNPNIGDSELNISRKGGLHNLIFELAQPTKYTKDHVWYFDFICLTNDAMENHEMMN